MPIEVKIDKYERKFIDKQGREISSPFSRGISSRRPTVAPTPNGTVNQEEGGKSEKGKNKKP